MSFMKYTYDVKNNPYACIHNIQEVNMLSMLLRCLILLYCFIIVLNKRTHPPALDECVRLR